MGKIAEWQLTLYEIINYMMGKYKLTHHQMLDFLWKESAALAESNKVSAKEFKRCLTKLGNMYEKTLNEE